MLSFLDASDVSVNYTYLRLNDSIKNLLHQVTALPLECSMFFRKLHPFSSRLFIPIITYSLSFTQISFNSLLHICHCQTRHHCRGSQHSRCNSKFKLHSLNSAPFQRLSYISSVPSAPVLQYNIPSAEAQEISIVF